MSEELRRKWFCSNCGFENEGNFCCQCGSPRPDSVAATTVQPEHSQNISDYANEQPAAPVSPETIRPSQTQAEPSEVIPSTGYTYVAPDGTSQVSSGKPYEPEDKKKATIWCIVSLGLMFVLPMLAGVITVLMNEYLDNGSALQASMSMIFGGIVSFSPIAAIGTMIYVRIKYPKSIFGTVLMWLYIALAIIFVICVIVVFVMCVNELNRCRNAGW